MYYASNTAETSTESSVEEKEVANVRIPSITDINANGTSFDFLKEEPDFYSIRDITNS